MHHELKDIIEGTKRIAESDSIQSIINYLRNCKTTSRTIEKTEFISKKDEEQYLISYANEKSLWFDIDENDYIGEGAEQKVYFLKDGLHVIKANDTIFYEYWEDYFISLLIHNYLFPSTLYQFIGFCIKNETLYAVVKQRFIISTDPTNLIEVKEFLENNDFKNIRYNDYMNIDLGIILEDLHDENVLTNNGLFFFIDTVIYLIKKP